MFSKGYVFILWFGLGVGMVANASEIEMDTSEPVQIVYDLNAPLWQFYQLAVQNPSKAHAQCLLIAQDKMPENEVQVIELFKLFMFRSLFELQPLTVPKFVRNDEFLAKFSAGFREQMVSWLFFFEHQSLERRKLLAAQQTLALQVRREKNRAKQLKNQLERLQAIERSLSESRGELPSP